MTTTVLGAGYAGIMAANRLAGQGEEVVLIAPQPWLVERIRLHAVAGGTRANARRDLSTLLNPAITVITDTATRIDDDSVLLASGRVVRYDTLIYAVGSGASSPSSSPSSSKAYEINSEHEALRLRDALELRPEASVTIIGAGLTGIELAATLRRTGRAVRLVSAQLPQAGATHVLLEELRKLGVQIEHGRVPDARSSASAHDDEITVNATGLVVPRLAADSGLPTDEHGRLLVNEQLTVEDHPRILGAGDAAFLSSPSAAYLRAACATALPMGAYAADVVLARKKGNTIAPFAMGYALQCVDLGAAKGRVQFVHPDDSERRFALGGRAGGLLKETICRMTIRWLTQESTQAGRYSWPSPPRALVANLASAAE